jgi:hypothetical protein
MLLLHGASTPYAEAGLRLVGILMFVVPSLLTRPALWWMLLVALVSGNAVTWHSIDNHKYLMVYWVLACTLSLHATSAGLDRTARILVGLVFSFAVSWKLLEGQYIDGSFFYFTFFTDGRAQRLASAIGSMPLQDVTVVRDALAFAGARGLSVPLHVPDSPTLATVSLVASWLTLIGESVVALIHLLPSDRLYGARHILLFGFIVATYFVLPVVGFAFMLCILGLAQCRDDDVTNKVRYVLILAAMQLAVVPWKQILIGD